MVKDKLIEEVDAKVSWSGSGIGRWLHWGAVSEALYHMSYVGLGKRLEILTESCSFGVEIAPIKFPDFLDRSQIVTRGQVLMC